VGRTERHIGCVGRTERHIGVVSSWFVLLMVG
jgi:hypothetical protein